MRAHTRTDEAQCMKLREVASQTSIPGKLRAMSGEPDHKDTYGTHNLPQRTADGCRRPSHNQSIHQGTLDDAI